MLRASHYYLQSFLTLLITAALSSCGGGGGGGGGGSTPPIITAIRHTIEGVVVKGVISGASISVVDADGNTVSGAVTTTSADGSYVLQFTAESEVVQPLQVVVDGSGAQSVCDVDPICEIGTDSSGNPLAVGFGETYMLPDGFRIRAIVQQLSDNGVDAVAGTANISPLTEFVTALALSMGDGNTLSAADVDTANDTIIGLIQSLYPTLEIADGTDLAQVSLPDITNLEDAPTAQLNELNLAIASISAAVATFVDAGSTDRGDIAKVIDDFVGRILENDANDDGVLSEQLESLLASQAITSLDSTLIALESLLDSGDLTLPDDTSLQELTQIKASAEASLPEIVDIWVNLTPGEHTAQVDSSAAGWVDLIVFPESGDLLIVLETDGITATQAHLHEGYAGTNGGILVTLEQDPNNPGRWVSPPDAVLNAQQMATLLMGGTYFNVHSEAFPAGELRGQVLPVSTGMILTELSGREEVPSVTTGGLGKGAVTWNISTATAQIHVTTTGVEVAAAHVHQGLAGTNGGIVIGLQQDPDNPSHWFASDIEMDADMMMLLATARLYFNVHSSGNPAGEIRAQIVAMEYQVLLSDMDPKQEVSDEEIASEAGGVSALTVNKTMRAFSIHVNSIGVDDAVAAHIHGAAAGENGAVLFPLTQDPNNPGHWFVEMQTFSDEQLGLFFNGELYVNVHTPAYPGGEIRGQLTTTVPGTGDSDGDGVVDRDDDFPDDPDESTDSDGDGVGDNVDAFPNDASESLDSDDDGVGDNSDQFPDDPLEDTDSDGDGVGDNADEFPDDPAEVKDSDGDGVGDNADAFPNDAAETTDSDGDGIGDNADTVDDSVDTDGDGVNDVNDDFPSDPDETTDTDGDGVGDNADAFPNDANETLDSDGDGVGDNADAFPNDAAETTDTDGDGVGNNSDAFPADPAETVDTDGDGVGNNSDAFPTDASETTDSDGDGVGDNSDAFPSDATETLDSDSDGVGNNADAFPNDATETTDTDGDGVGDNTDVFPADATESADSDNDGVGNNSDNCPTDSNSSQADADGDGIGDACESAPSFSQVQSIFNSRCVVCHGGSGGLFLNAASSFGNLVNVPSLGVPSVDRVEPGDPDNSYIVWKLEGRSGIVGSRMPLGGVLPQSDIDLIRQWIAAGASQN